jgi:hypothetical protein
LDFDKIFPLNMKQTQENTIVWYFNLKKEENVIFCFTSHNLTLKTKPPISVISEVDFLKHCK